MSISAWLAKAGVIPRRDLKWIGETDGLARVLTRAAESCGGPVSAASFVLTTLDGYRSHTGALKPAYDRLRRFLAAEHLMSRFSSERELRTGKRGVFLSSGSTAIFDFALGHLPAGCVRVADVVRAFHTSLCVSGHHRQARDLAMLWLDHDPTALAFSEPETVTQGPVTKGRAHTDLMLEHTLAMDDDVEIAELDYDRLARMQPSPVQLWRTWRVNGTPIDESLRQALANIDQPGLRGLLREAEARNDFEGAAFIRDTLATRDSAGASHKPWERPGW